MKENLVSIVAAMDEKRGIGKNNDLLFRIPQDFERMRRLTRGHPLVMGRKTFESIGRVLPERTSIVITRDPERVRSVSFYSPEVTIARDLIAGIEKAKQSPGSEEIFIFGGGEIFREAIEKGLVDKLYLTIVEGDFGADTFFPDYSEFKRLMKEEFGESEGIKFRFIDLEK
ncbi:MAG: dihydrofolate reductase [Candidatus Levybacteria bacterium]|nr:dihydrofolate reductase [Candidatus Levybacteria bacterium]